MTSISHTQSSGILDTSPFRTPGLSIHKTMTMTAGEFDYDTIFGNSGDDKDQLTEFAGLAYFMWIVFLIAMHILLVNLLVSECMCLGAYIHVYTHIVCRRVCTSAEAIDLSIYSIIMFNLNITNSASKSINHRK